MVTRQKRLHFGLFSYKLADATTNRSKILTLCFFPSRFSYSPEIQTIALKQRQEWRRDGLIFFLGGFSANKCQRQCYWIKV